MEAKVKRDFHGNIALELERGKGKVRYIHLDGLTRVTDTTSIQAFDKQYSDYDYPIAKLAERWLTHRKYHTLTRTTEKELIMIAILNADLSNVIGKVADDDQKLAGILAGETGVIVLDAKDLAASLKEQQMVDLYNKMVPEDKKITGRAKGGKALFSAELWKVIEEFQLQPVVGAVHKGDGPVAKSHQIFATNPGKSRKELIELCVEAGINKATATTQYGVFHKESLMTTDGKVTIERNGNVSKVKAIIAENYGKKSRKDIIALCEAAGLNKATASTQYGLYNKSMVEKQKQIDATAGGEGATEGATEGAEQAAEVAEGAEPAEGQEQGAEVTE